MIAGTAITSLLKMNGEDATAIACAAFCIPTSIMMVRCCWRFREKTFSRSQAPLTASNNMAVTDAPRTRKLSQMTDIFCTKNKPARNINRTF